MSHNAHACQWMLLFSAGNPARLCWIELLAHTQAMTTIPPLCHEKLHNPTTPLPRPLSLTCNFPFLVHLLTRSNHSGHAPTAVNQCCRLLFFSVGNPACLCWIELLAHKTAMTTIPTLLHKKQHNPTTPVPRPKSLTCNFPFLVHLLNCKNNSGHAMTTVWACISRPRWAAVAPTHHPSIAPTPTCNHRVLAILHELAPAHKLHLVHILTCQHIEPLQNSHTLQVSSVLTWNS